MRKINNLIKKIPRAIKDPKRAIVLLWRRMFPFGIVPKDPEAYRIGSWSYGKIKRVPLKDIFHGIEDTDITLTRTYNRNVDTSIDINEIVALSAIIKFVNAHKMIEVGTYDGNTALNFSANLPDDGIITTIDLPPDGNAKLSMDVPATFVNVSNKRTVELQYKDSKYARKIRQVYGDSARLDWESFGRDYDVVFVDGCHFYDYVKMDTENAFKVLKPDGLIIWHDYGMIEDVSKVVDEMSGFIEIRVISGTRLAVGFVGKKVI